MGRNGVMRMTGQLEFTEDSEIVLRLPENDQGFFEDILRSRGGGILAILRRRLRCILRE
jgi:hypothetical protein